MLKPMIVVLIVAAALVAVGWKFRDMRKRARRHRRRRKVNRYWTVYAKVWDTVFSRDKIHRITHVEPSEPAE
jgi:heme/copper-type cytochrome/quinol oxidase subunit 2